MVSDASCPAQRGGGWSVHRAPTFTTVMITPEVSYFPKPTQIMPVGLFI
jgi:hypothetical protein